MKRVTRYLNTDLCLISTDDLTELVAAFKAGGVSLLCPHDELRAHEGRYFVAFEANEFYTEPEPSIAAMLDVIEALPAPLRALWDRCQQREFNMGFDCGDEPWSYIQTLSPRLLERLAATGACLALTLYPATDDDARPEDATNADE